ncbi:MAG: sporulation protein YqfD [Clostridia bacterium]|nr:sporulation protein YqfD [Clostridia bacterium]
MKGTGQVQFRVKGLGVEKLLNAARKQGISFSRVKREKSRSLLLRCSSKDYEAFSELAKEKGFEVSEAQPVGVLRLEKQAGKRIGLLIGGLAAIGLLIWALGYVWEVRVENAGAYLGEVRSYLEEQGIRPGIRRASVSLSDLRDKLEWRLPKVKWVRAEWQGVSLVVRLEEGVPPPEAASNEGAGDVVAASDGIIRRVTTYAGTPLVKAGDFVKAGQTLIRGEERDKDGAARPVRARGEALARQWVSVQVRTPVTGFVSEPTGRETTRRVIETPVFTWAREDAPDYLTSEKSREAVPIGGAWWPVGLLRETYAEVSLRKESRDLEEAKREGAKAAIFALNQALMNDETVDKWINFSMIEGETITVTATAEIIRDIGCRP